ncbi:MAG: formylmethanofuran dehydrogenase subunit C [Candidatus Thorarchaeota archaeon]|nr:MAG: formylmethanofuran dehydrogenase subunit C [Candidatus Thorarchaeota archaeon]RLI55011.1 MAG: formylmethanofuran dehydrogenase subunit C [Candidatus Thorarchaeota archaeon]
MTVYVTLKQVPDIPIEADTITPSAFAGKTPAQIGEMELLQGREFCKLGDFFEVEGVPGGTPEETEIVLRGDLRRVKYIGKGMNGGIIRIEGDVGMHLGAEIIAGRITVTGSVDSWAGAEMSGGNIQIEGDAGDYLCAAYRGSPDGMTGGRVYVAGNVGCEMALHMRKGFIAVKGSVGEMAASRMRGGSIMVCGELGPRACTEARRGMLFALGPVKSLPPTYKYSGCSEREFTGYYVRYLKDRRPDFVPSDIPASEKWVKFVGDLAEEESRMEVYARLALNPHLVS